MIRLEVKGKPPSLNDWYSGGHWSKRKAVADEWHGLFHAAFIDANLPRRLETPIVVNVTQFSKGRLRDADNVVVSAKFCLDALRLYGYIEDDSPRYVSCVVLQSRKGEEDKVVVIIS